MSSAAAGKFQDHYKILSVDPKATPDIIQLAYNALFAMYMADSDSQKLDEINLALEVLLEPNSRKIFDSVRGGDDERDISFSGMDFFNSLQDELNCRMTMLCILYDVRRQNPRVPLITMRQFEQIADMTEVQIQLSLWYVKTLGFVTVDDKSKMQITASGMDYLQANIPDPSTIWPFLKNPSGPKPEQKALAQQEQEVATSGIAVLSTALKSFTLPEPVPVPQPFAPHQPMPPRPLLSQPVEALRPKTMSMLRRASVSVSEA